MLVLTGSDLQHTISFFVSGRLLQSFYSGSRNESRELLVFSSRTSFKCHGEKTLKRRKW